MPSTRSGQRTVASREEALLRIADLIASQPSRRLPSSDGFVDAVRKVLADQGYPTSRSKVRREVTPAAPEPRLLYWGDGNWTKHLAGAQLIEEDVAEAIAHAMRGFVRDRPGGGVMVVKPQPQAAAAPYWEYYTREGSWSRDESAAALLEPSAAMKHLQRGAELAPQR